MSKSIFTAIISLTSIVSQGQNIPDLRFLYLTTDEIIVVEKLDERTSIESFIQSTSYVKARVIENLKIKRLTLNDTIIHFVRTLPAAKAGVVPDEWLLDKNKRYIVYLTSEQPGYDLIRKIRLYGLSDVTLGVQEYNEDIIRHIRNKYTEKH